MSPRQSSCVGEKHIQTYHCGSLTIVFGDVRQFPNDAGLSSATHMFVVTHASYSCSESRITPKEHQMNTKATQNDHHVSLAMIVSLTTII